MSECREQTKSEEVTNAVLHGIGVGLSIAALVILIIFARLNGNISHTIGFSVYGTTLIVLYLSSTLYHSFSRVKIKKFLRIMDHSSIFLLIAGTYTPLTLISLQGNIGWILLAVIWSIALIGVFLKIVWFNQTAIASLVLYVVMGWLIIFAIKPLVASIDPIGIRLLILGGVLYTIGIIFYRLRQVRFSHAIWHLFVLAGSICHFFTMLFLI